MSVLETLKNAVGANNIASSSFPISEVMTELTFETCSRKRYDIPQKYISHAILRELPLPEDTCFLNTYNIVAPERHAFDPAVTRTVILGQANMTFITLLAGELFRLLSLVKSELNADELEKLETLKAMVITPSGERRLKFSNPHTDEIMDLLITGLLNNTKVKLPAHPNQCQEPIIELYQEINAFYASKPDAELIIRSLHGLIERTVVVLVQVSNDLLAESMLNGFNDRNEPN